VTATMPSPAGSWFGAPTEPPQVGLDPERVVDILRHELRELPMSGYPITITPMVVPRPSYLELMTATRDLLDLLRRAVINIADDRAGRIEALDLDPDDFPMVTDDDDFELRHCADMARPDVVIGADGPKFVEFNVSGAFGGMVHFQLYQRSWQRIRELAGAPAYVGMGAFSRLALLIEEVCAELRVPPAATLIGTPREWGPETSPRHFEIQANMLRGYGIHAEHLDFEELLTGLGRRGPLSEQIGIGEFTVQDANELGYDVSPVRTALDAGFRLIPSGSCWLLHTKKLLGLLSEGQPWMDAADRALAARYLPWTRLVGDRKVRWHDEQHDLARLLIDQRDRFVLKGATGCSGSEVIFGSRVTAPAWSDAVDMALRDGYHVAQEVVESLPYPLDVSPAPGEVVRVRANSVISPFAIGGRAAGCFARFVTDDQPGVISALSRAQLTCLLAEA
jgi:hypothetical protein